MTLRRLPAASATICALAVTHPAAAQRTAAELPREWLAKRDRSNLSGDLPPLKVSRGL
jgi:hypothetical protein